ncbi:MAG: hypothetical protein AB1410_06315 [Acidobacteriota bacterium]
MKVKGRIKGKTIILEKALSIPDETEVEIELLLAEEYINSVFGIWKDRDDIPDSSKWIEERREKDWKRM